MKKQVLPKLTFTIQVFREGRTFVAYNPELDVSSCGDTLEKARENLYDAVRGFLGSAHAHGTLPSILEEAGYTHKRNQWHDPNLMVLDRFSLTV